MLCPSCGSQNAEGVSYCSTCGAEITSSCASCGRNLAPGSQFCDVCGTPVVNGVTQTIVGSPALEAMPTKSGSACTLPVFGENGELARFTPESAREGLLAQHSNGLDLHRRLRLGRRRGSILRISGAASRGEQYREEVYDRRRWG